MATKREVELARHLRRQATGAERVAWKSLRARRCEGMKFKRQEPLGDFIVDFYCPELKLAIELDGTVHDKPEQAAKDRLRTERLETLGVKVVRVPNERVGPAVLRQIVLRHLRSPSPRVSVERGPGGEAWREPEPGG